MPAYADLTDAQLDKAAEGVCGIFDAEDSPEGWASAVDAATSNGADAAQANVLVQAAVHAYCPQFIVDIPDSEK